MSGLKSCPFCGGEIVSTHYKYPSGTVAVCCETCGAGFVRSGENALNDAHEAWNIRAEQICKRITHGLERDREVATVSWTCSECSGHIGRDHSYCPNCGAKVVEE